MSEKLAIREAPVFYPTLEDFKDPYAYIAKIRPIAEQFGICKVVSPRTPENLKRGDQVFPDGLDPEIEFITKLQPIHQLQKRDGPNMLFLKNLVTFLRDKKNIRLTSVPKVEGREVDLYNLFYAVLERGGHQEVMRNRGKAWRDIARELRLTHTSDSTADQLATVYSKYLLDFEGTYKKRKRTHMESDGKGRKKPSEHATCEVCRSKEDQGSMLVCENAECHRTFHLKCMSPPMACVPRGEWLCESCTQKIIEAHDPKEDQDEETSFNFGTASFGYGEGGRFTLAQFKKIADQFKRKWFNKLSDEEFAALTPADVEEEYWKIVESSDDYVQVFYGSDVNTIVVGSGFGREGLEDRHTRRLPVASTAPDSPHAPGSSPPRDAPPATTGSLSPFHDLWNLNILPTHNRSVLSFLDPESDVPGVKTSMLYIGMLFSTFAWHNEDCYLPSMAFVHTGAPKTWYGVPGAAAEHFESVMRSYVPRLFEKDPDLLFNLVTMLSPHHLAAKGVPVCHTVQTPGDYIVTFPAAYHAGFSHGFNCGEAVNFAIPEWLPWGAKATDRYRLSARPPVCSVDMIVHRLACSGAPPEAAKYVAAELRRMRNEEKEERIRLHKEGFRRCELVDDSVEKGMSEDDLAQCSVCKFDCYLSYVACDCTPDEVVCLRHAHKLCKCSNDRKRLAMRLTLGDLDKLISTTEAIAASSAPLPPLLKGVEKDAGAMATEM